MSCQGILGVVCRSIKSTKHKKNFIRKLLKKFAFLVSVEKPHKEKNYPKLDQLKNFIIIHHFKLLFQIKKYTDLYFTFKWSIEVHKVFVDVIAVVLADPQFGRPLQPQLINGNFTFGPLNKCWFF